MRVDAKSKRLSIQDAAPIAKVEQTEGADKEDKCDSEREEILFVKVKFYEYLRGGI